MNIPSVYRKALNGFIVPPRAFGDVLSSAIMGGFSLFNEQTRATFIDNLDKGIINEGIIAQATMSPLMMLSLFHDMENPLFRRYNFDAKEFLSGVAPALENFHNVSGVLENEFHLIRAEADTTTLSTEEKKDSGNGEAEEKRENRSTMTDEEKEAVLAGFRLYQGTEMFSSGLEEKHVSAILNKEWMEDVKNNPESLAGQLSRMVTSELFQIHQMSAKTAFFLQNQTRNIKFEEGSCTVNNVALLSARAFLCVPSEVGDGDDDSKPMFEPVDYMMDEKEMKEKKAVVAAQMEVLYDVTQSFVVEESESESEKKNEEGEELKVADSEPMSTTIVSVATLQGWLTGGPDGKLRWQLALHRPPFEFPAIQAAY
jgi:hypothetical protein